MRKTMVIIKPSRLKRIPVKQWLFLLGLLALALLFLWGTRSYPHLTTENTHALTGPVSGIHFTEGWGLHGPAYAALEIDGESCKIALNGRDLSLLLRSEDVTDSAKTARVLVSDRGEIAELEFEGKRYHTLDEENHQRSSKRTMLCVFAIVFLFLDGVLFFADLSGYGIVIFRTRPKNRKQFILVEK